MTFCESSIISPEWVNSFTSLIMSIFGIIGLYSYNNIIYIKLFYAFMICLGIGSFGYHFTYQDPWRFADVFGMVNVALISLIIYIYILITLEFKKQLNYKIKNIINNITCILISSYIIILSIFAGIEKMEKYTYLSYVFNMLFGIFLFIIIAIVLYIRFKYHNFVCNFIIETEKQGSYINQHILNNYAIIGVSMLIIAVICLLITENLCKTNPDIAYFPGHGLWHTCLGFGSYYLSIYSTSLLYYINNNKYILYTNKWYNKIVPIIELVDHKSDENIMLI